MSVCSDGKHYDVPEGLIFSFPCTVKDGKWKIVDGFGNPNIYICVAEGDDTHIKSEIRLLPEAPEECFFVMMRKMPIRFANGQRKAVKERRGISTRRSAITTV